MSAKKIDTFHSRAARYVLNYNDNSIVRFAAFAKGSRKLQTRIINLSETGMAFLLPIVDNPEADETIKVEFLVPGKGAIACFAKVMRTESHQLFDKNGYRQNFKLVAVTFIDLPVAQRQEIRDGLLEKFEEQRRQQMEEQFRLKMQWMAQQSADAAKAVFMTPVRWLSGFLKK